VFNMNSIWGILPGLTNNDVSGVKSSNKTNDSSNNYKGPNFVESLRDIAKAANIEVAKGYNAANLSLTRQKEMQDEPFNFEEAGEELLEDYITRIKKMLKDMGAK